MCADFICYFYVNVYMHIHICICIYVLNSADEDPLMPSMGAKSLCIPLVQPANAAGKSCIKCAKPAKSYTLFGRSY